MVGFLPLAVWGFPIAGERQRALIIMHYIYFEGAGRCGSGTRQRAYVVLKTYIISSHNDNMIYFLLLFGLRPGSPAPLSSAPACGILLHQGSIHPFVLVMTLTVALALAGGRECARGRRTKKNESVCSWVERHWATKRAACLCNVLV